MEDLTIPAGAGAVIGVLGGVVAKLWSDGKTQDREHKDEIAALEKKHEAEIAAMQARLDKTQEELKTEIKSRLRDAEIFVKALEQKRSKSLPPSE